MSAFPKTYAIRGRFVHGKSTSMPGELEYVEDGLLEVSDGVITHFTKGSKMGARVAALGDTPVITLESDEFMVPGLIDCHVHAAQYAYIGTATDKPLMQWLQKYTFPAERRCEDVKYARNVYEKLINRLLRNGTTAAAMYATIHVPATKVLVDICLEKGFRAVIGKVCMDRHGADDYEESTEDALAGTKECIQYVRAAQPGVTGPARLVQPCVVPRFVPTCTPALLKGLGALAKEAGDCWVQSHVSETPDQMAFVDSLHPGMRCTEIFDAAGLLTDKCVMAHCVYLQEDEMDLFAKRGSGVACCPLSNAVFSLSHGTNAFPLLKALQRGVRVGLGTDIAGGYAASILNACRHAVVASKHSHTCIDVDYRGAFWAATVGGALALGLDSVLGNFEPGKQFDACRVQCEAGVWDTFVEAIPEDTTRLAVDFEQFINLGDDRNIKTVFVQGRPVVNGCAVVG